MSCQSLNCTEIPVFQGYCSTHYKQQENIIFIGSRPKGSLPRIIWDEIPCSRLDLEGPCHIFQGAKNAGYGVIRFEGQTLRVHRYVWEQSYGLIPEDKILDHQCRNRACINLNHLRLVTRQINAIENTVDSFWQLQKAKIQCPQGHSLSGENLYTYPDGRRGCRECRKISVEQHRMQKRGY